AWLVGVILLLRDVGFSLAEQKAFMASRAAAPGDWRRLARRKLAELDDQIANAQTAPEAIDHPLVCPHDAIPHCPPLPPVTRPRAPPPRPAAPPRPPALAPPAPRWSVCRP